MHIQSKDDVTSYFSSFSIAYMEDDEIVREEVSRALEQKGINVELIYNTPDALEFAKATRERGNLKGLLILDIDMGANKSTQGIRISRAVKSGYQELRVVLLSSKLNELSAAMAKSAKADDILIKASIDKDIAAIVQQATIAIENSTPSVSREIDNVFLYLTQKYKGHFTIKSTSEVPDNNFFNMIDDKFVDRVHIANNLATELVQLHISSNQKHERDIFENFICDLSDASIPLRIEGPLGKYEQESITIMVLFPSTGAIYSFGREIAFHNMEISVTPGFFDFVDISCETSITEDQLSLIHI